MIQHLMFAGRYPYSAALLASVVSLALHIGTWLAWQAEPAKTIPAQTPPQVIEVELTAALPAKQPPVQAPKLESPPPKQEISTPKKLERPKPKPKPKQPTKPVPLLKPTPKLIAPTPVNTESRVDSTHEPVSIPVKPSAPVSESLVKAVYSSPSLKNPPTHYPRIAQVRQWEGTVILEIRVLANGSAADIKIAHSSGHEVLDDSAVEQVKAWRFIPAHKGDKTVDDWVRVPITFKFKH